MSCRCSPALVTLRDQINDAFPNRDRSSDGCCGDPAHQGRKSDHNADDGGFAHALDVDEDLDGASAWTPTNPAPLQHWLPSLLLDGRVKYVIYEARIYYGACRDHGLNCFANGGHAYTGPNAHKHHLHLSIYSWATASTALWPLPRAVQPPLPGDDDMPGPLDITSSVDWPAGGYIEQSYEGGLYSYEGAPEFDAYNEHDDWKQGGPRGFYDLDLWYEGSQVVGVVQVSTLPGQRYRVKPKA